MNIFKAVYNVVKRLFKTFMRTFLPDRRDLLGSIVLAVPLYLIFFSSIIFLLPLIIAGVVVVFSLRRIWKILTIYWTVKVMRKKTSKEIDKIRRTLR